MGSSPGPTGIRLLRAPEESPRLEWVGKGGVEPPRPFGHTDLNRARLPFRHLPWRATTVSAERRNPGEGSVVLPRGAGVRCGRTAAGRRPDGGSASPAAPRGAAGTRGAPPGGAGRSLAARPATIKHGDARAERKGATGGVLQRFERRLEGMVGLAFARVFKGKVHPAEIAKALQREADEQRSVLGEGRVLAPNVYEVRLGRVDYDNLAEWSDQLAGELADMVAEHIDAEGFEIFGEVTVTLELDEELPTGVFEVASHVADPAHPRHDAVGAGPPAVAPPNGHPPLPPLPPIRGRVPTDTGRQGPSIVGRAGGRP